MYQTQGTLKNINLRTEFKGDDERQGAFDLRIEAPLTPELHAFLCKHTDKAVPVKAFQSSGIAEIKYGIELENVLFKISEFEIKGCKVSKVIGKLAGKQMAVMRVQSQIHHRGLIDSLNDITGEPHTVIIGELQGDMLSEEVDQSAELAPKPQAENKEPSPKKKASKKKASKKKAVKKKVVDDESLALHVVGDKGADITEEEAAQRQKEKDALLSRVKTTKEPESNAGDEMQQALDMVLDLDGVTMGQGDASDLDNIKERLDAGRALNMSQVENLNELYNRYCA